MSSNQTKGGTARTGILSTGFPGTFLAAALLCAAASTVQAGGMLSIAFEDAIFDNSFIIDNPYWPLNPDDMDRTFVYEVETEDGCVIEEATVYGAGPVKVLDGAAPYDGFMAIVVEDIGYLDEDCDGNLVREEHTFDWYRQDIDGNIWYVGELSRSYEGDECSSYAGDPSEAEREENPDCYEGSWEAGKGPEGGLIAEAGIVVPSNQPIPGEPITAGTFYLQELADEAVDVAKVLKIDSNVKIKSDDGTEVYHHCRVTKEYSSLAPGSIEQKNYCPDDGGLVVIEELAGGKSVFVVLTEITPPLP